MNINYVANGSIDSKEVIEIFKSVGWTKDESNIIEAFKNSYYITAQDENGKLIGFARAISDHSYYTGIYDVIVRPDYQKLSIGRTMVNSLVEKFKGTYFFLTYTEGKRDFYERCGFQDSNNAMWIPK